MGFCKKDKIYNVNFSDYFFLPKTTFFLIPYWEGDSTAYSLQISNILTAFESVCWMLSFSGFASTYLNKKNNFLSYLTLAVFPIYIFHMPVQFLISSFLYPTSIAPTLKFIIVFLATILSCIVIYEIIKDSKGLRFFLGLRLNYSINLLARFSINLEVSFHLQYLEVQP